jgi:hypothetical protein
LAKPQAKSTKKTAIKVDRPQKNKAPLLVFLAAECGGSSFFWFARGTAGALLLLPWGAFFLRPVFLRQSFLLLFGACRKKK